MTETTTLTDFLLVRIAEDEGMAHADATMTPPSVRVGTTWPNHDPARRLVECEAKRRIVALQAADQPKPGAPPYNGPLNADDFGDGRHPDLVAYIERHCEPVTDTPILRALALPYADHPDYREEWKP